MLGGLAGLLAGVFASVAMHYGDYVQFQRERDAVPEHIRQIAGLIGERAPNVQPLNPPPVKPGDPPVKPLDKALLADLQELGKQMKVTNFFEYVDYAAHVGVSLKRAGHGDQGMNLGYIGTYIYWIVEALIVALVALAMTHKSASEPFCTACERWKTSHTLGSVLGSPQDVLDVLRSGHPGRLRLHQPTSNPGELAFTVWECPKCEAAAPFEIKLQHVTQSAKNETRTKDLGCFTYPGEALPVLEAMFQPVVEEVQTADGEKPKTDAAASS
jgi:hypothetical protein